MHEDAFQRVLKGMVFAQGDGGEDVLKRYIPWRLTDDKDLMVVNGSLTPFCNTMQKLSAEHGLVDIQVLDHTHTPKLRPVTRHWYCLLFLLGVSGMYTEAR